MARCTGHIHSGEQVVPCIKENHPPEEPCLGWLLLNWGSAENNHGHDAPPSPSPKQELIHHGEVVYPRAPGVDS